MRGRAEGRHCRCEPDFSDFFVGPCRNKWRRARREIAGHGFGGLGDLMFQGFGWLIMLAVIVVLGVAAAMARIAVRRMARRKHRLHFEKARSRSYAESSAHYKEA